MQTKVDPLCQYFKFTRTKDTAPEAAVHEFTNLMGNFCPYKSLDIVALPESADHYVKVNFEKPPSKYDLRNLNYQLKHSDLLTLPTENNPSEFQQEYEKTEQALKEHAKTQYIRCYLKPDTNHAHWAENFQNRLKRDFEQVTSVDFVEQGNELFFKVRCSDKDAFNQQFSKSLGDLKTQEGVYTIEFGKASIKASYEKGDNNLLMSELEERHASSDLDEDVWIGELEDRQAIVEVDAVEAREMINQYKAAVPKDPDKKDEHQSTEETSHRNTV